MRVLYHNSYSIYIPLNSKSFLYNKNYIPFNQQSDYTFISKKLTNYLIWPYLTATIELPFNNLRKIQLQAKRESLEINMLKEPNKTTHPMKYLNWRVNQIQTLGTCLQGTTLRGRTYSIPFTIGRRLRDSTLWPCSPRPSRRRSQELPRENHGDGEANENSKRTRVLQTRTTQNTTDGTDSFDQLGNWYLVIDEEEEELRYSAIEELGKPSD